MSVAAVACAAVSSNGLAQPGSSFTGLGVLPGGNISCAHAVSADGSVVVGFGGSASGSHEAFRWTQAGGMLSLGVLPGGSDSDAAGVSADGSVVVGFGSSASGSNEAFRWTQAGGMVGLGTLPGGSYSLANGVSAYGSVVVGSGISASGYVEAFRWTQAGSMVGLGTLPGGSQSVAHGVSADGSVVVGNDYPGAGGGEAFRWTQGGGMVGVGVLPGGSYSSGNGVSAGGAVVVGDGANASNNQEAFRWTQAGGMVGLGVLPGVSYSNALGVSGDGATIVGIGNMAGSDNTAAFVWDQLHGMRNLRDVLLNDLCLDLSGWTLGAAMAISADGTAVVGFGRNPDGQTEAWVARVSFADADGDGVSDPCDQCAGFDDHADVDADGIPDGCDTVELYEANPPAINPYASGAHFRDVLQTGPSGALLQGIGSCLTPNEGAVGYCNVAITFSGLIAMQATDVQVVCSFTGAPAGSAPCPTVTEVVGSGIGPYLIALSGPIPPGGCTTLTFANAAPGLTLRYDYLPGDVNMSGTTTGQDVLALVTAINQGTAGGPANLPRYDINRNGVVTGQDVLRIVQLVNGQNTTQEWNGATLVPCP